jgi:hypothetical protein
MAAHFTGRVVQRFEGTLDEALRRAAACGLDAGLVRACLARGGDAGARFAELVVRIEEADRERVIGAVSPTFVLRLFWDALGGDARAAARYAPWRSEDDDEFGRLTIWSMLTPSDAPLAFVVTARSEASARTHGEDPGARAWVELRVWIAEALVPALREPGARWDSTAEGSAGGLSRETFHQVDDAYMTAFPPAPAVTGLRYRGSCAPSSEAVGSVALTPDGAVVLCVEARGRVRAFDTESLKELKRWKDATRGASVKRVTADPLAGRVLLTDRAGRVTERDREGDELRATLAFEDAIGELTFAPGGELLERVSSDDEERGRVYLRDRERFARVRCLVSHDAALRALALAHEAPVGVSADASGHVALWHLAEERPRWTRRYAEGDAELLSVAASDDGAEVYALLRTGEILALDGATGERVRSLRSDVAESAVLFVVPGGRALGVWYDEQVSLWDLDRAEVVRVTRTPPLRGDGALLRSRDGRRIVLADPTHVHVFDAP